MNPTLRIRKLGIDTYRENIVYVSSDSDICQSQGLRALSKLEVHYRHGQHRNKILATLNMTANGMLHPGEIGLSDVAYRRLGAPEGGKVTLSHPSPLISTDFIRQKLDGEILSRDQIFQMIRDIADYRYSNIELTAFAIACGKRNLSKQEIVFLTEAMVETGETIDWKLPMVLDKHCIGGLPGNRTTMIVVPIIAALGLPMPKTSSRAITSPAGTADTMEAMTNVALSLPQIKKIIAEENACIAWGGALHLAPVDDIIISVERPLSLDSEGQMIASILSKKKAAGSTHVLIDIPVGPTAKVSNRREASRLKKLFETIGQKIGLKILVLVTDGRQPIGRGIGPVLEAQDVLQVLKNEATIHDISDLKEKSLLLAGRLIEFCKKARKGKGIALARHVLESGQAFEKFESILRSQGPLKKLEVGSHRHLVKSRIAGPVLSIHNQKIAKVAKLAGAPGSPGAGVYLHVKIGQTVRRDDVLFEIFATHQESLSFAVGYVTENRDIIRFT